MEFLRKKFRRKSTAAAAGYDHQGYETLNENTDESFAFLQLAEEDYDPLEYDRQQVCRCYDRKTDKEDHKKCRSHLESVDQRSVSHGEQEKENLDTSPDHGHQPVTQNRELVGTLPQRKCLCSCVDFHNQGNPEVSARFPTCHSIEAVPGKVGAVEDARSGPEPRINSCDENDKLSWGCTFSLQADSSLKRSESSGDMGRHSKKMKQSPVYDICLEHNMISEDINGGNERQIYCKGSDTEEVMLSSGSLTASATSSVSSTDSATRGSYTLWRSIDGENEPHSGDDTNDDYSTPESTLRRTPCSWGNSSNHDQFVPSLKRKLVPHLKDSESNDSIASLDFQVKPKCPPAPFEHMEDVRLLGVVGCSSKNCNVLEQLNVDDGSDNCSSKNCNVLEQLNVDDGSDNCSSKNCNVLEQLNVDDGSDNCSSENQITIESSNCGGKSSTFPPGRFGNHLEGRVECDVDKKDGTSFTTEAFLTSSPQIIHDSSPARGRIFDEDMRSGVTDSDRAYCHSNDNHRPIDHRYIGRNNSNYQTTDSLQTFSVISSTPPNGAASHPNGGGVDSDNFHTPTINQNHQVLPENDSSVWEGDSLNIPSCDQHDISDVGSMQTANDISFSSHYDTCTSTLDGYVIYDEGMVSKQLAGDDSKNELKITSRNSIIGSERGYRKTSEIENDNIRVHENVSIADCLMCGKMTAFEHDNEADIQRLRHFQAMLTLVQAKDMNNTKYEPIQEQFLAPKTLNSTENPSLPLMRSKADIDGDSLQEGKAPEEQKRHMSRQEGGLFLAKGAKCGNSTTGRHVAETLANNAAAIILLLDHKMCERSWTVNQDAGMNESLHSQNLPDGFSYGDEGEDEHPVSGEDSRRMGASSDESKTKRKLEHRRSRSFGSSVSRAITDAVNKLEEISHESRNKQYHKLFKFIPEDEGLIVSFSCALVRDILLQGRLYLSENWVCFHSNIFTFETLVTASMDEIQNITKERTAFVVPNAIGIHTQTNKYVFGSLLSRHSTYKQFVKVWKKSHVLDETTSQESGSRVGSERDALDVDEIATEEGEDADIEEEDVDGGLVLRIDHHEDLLPCDVHANPHSPTEFPEGSIPSRRVSSTTKQMKPSKMQFFLAQILSLVQAILAIGVYKSLRRFIRHQPFLAFSVLMFFILSMSALVMSYKILTFKSADQHLFHDTYHELSSLGHVLLSHHHSKHDQVRRVQNKLTNQLKSMIKHQTDQPTSNDDEIS